jgi:hypothetical protein
MFYRMLLVVGEALFGGENVEGIPAANLAACRSRARPTGRSAQAACRDYVGIQLC